VPVRALHALAPHFRAFHLSNVFAFSLLAALLPVLLAAAPPLSHTAGAAVRMSSSMSRSIEELQTIAKRVRREIIEMTGAAKSGHPGGSLSATDIVVELYFDYMRHDPKNPKWPDRDRFILSKGHAAPVLYAAMAEAGYTPIDQLS